LKYIEELIIGKSLGVVVHMKYLKYLSLSN
jgi:hypothetical protein